MWSALFLFICAILQSGFTPVDCWQVCNENEEYVDNVNPCNDCKYLEGTCVVSGEMGPGCDCKSGFYRNEESVCFQRSECFEHCGTNEIFKECGTACPKTCANKNAAIKCISKCVKGCFCKDGYVRNNKGKCVKPNQCPTDVCGANEVYKDYGTACLCTCKNRNIKIRCIDKCVEGCFCKDGYVRNDDGILFKPSQCPSAPSVWHSIALAALVPLIPNQPTNQKACAC